MDEHSFQANDQCRHCPGGSFRITATDEQVRMPTGKDDRPIACSAGFLSATREVHSGLNDRMGIFCADLVSMVVHFLNLAQSPLAICWSYECNSPDRLSLLTGWHNASELSVLRMAWSCRALLIESALSSGRRRSDTDRSLSKRPDNAATAHASSSVSPRPSTFRGDTPGSTIVQ
jgi:hypothetical protein